MSDAAPGGSDRVAGLIGQVGRTRNGEVVHAEKRLNGSPRREGRPDVLRPYVGWSQMRDRPSRRLSVSSSRCTWPGKKGEEAQTCASV